MGVVTEFVALDTLGGREGSMGLNQEVFVQPCQAFEHINVLCVRSQKQVLLGQQRQQVVRERWLKSENEKNGIYN